jgi:topoisomerase-4 subunit A
MNNKNIINTNNSSSQKDGFINNIKNLLVLNQNSQIPTYEGLKIRMQTIIDTAKTIYRNLANVLPEIESHISAGKLVSTMYLKIHEMMIESKNAHIREYIVKEKKILKIRKLALKIERKCRKCLFILYDLIQSTKILIIPNYEKIETLQIQLENMYSLRPRTAIYYGEEDGNFDDPTDADYNPSDDEEEYDEEEFNFDEDDNDSEYDPSDDEENDDEEFDFDEADEEEDEDDDSDYDYEDEDEYSTEDAEFMDEYNNDPEYLLDEDQDNDSDSDYSPSDEEYEEFDFVEVDDNDSEYTPSEADEDDEEYNFDEEDDNDSDYAPSEADEDEEEFDFDEEDEEDEDEDEEYEEQADEDDKQFVSDYLNDPDYNPDEDEDEEDDLEYDFGYLNKKVDDDGNIVLKAGIADDNDEEDPDYDPTDDEDDEDDEDIKYVNNKNILNICKRRFENGKVVYRWVKMTKEQAEKKYDEDYDCEEN